MNPGTDFSEFAMKFLGYNLSDNKYINAALTIFYEIIFFAMLVLSSLEIILNFKNIVQLVEASKIIPHFYMVRNENITFNKKCITLVQQFYKIEFSTLQMKNFRECTKLEYIICIWWILKIY